MADMDGNPYKPPAQSSVKIPQLSLAMLGVLLLAAFAGACALVAMLFMEVVLIVYWFGVPD